MKKARIIKCIAIFFVVSFCFSSLTATAIIEETISIPVPTDRSEDFYVTQAESIYIYNDLLNSFNTERTSISNTQTEKQEYPDYFGGAYINQETGGLVIKTTDVAQIKRSCGIHSARETNGTDRYFSPYSNIVDELGIECITY